MKMNKKRYIRPVLEIVNVNLESLMETWSIAVDHNPNNGIKPGDEGDIGAKQSNFGYHWGDVRKSLWDD